MRASRRARLPRPPPSRGRSLTAPPAPPSSAATPPGVAPARPTRKPACGGTRKPVRVPSKARKRSALFSNVSEARQEIVSHGAAENTELILCGRSGRSPLSRECGHASPRDRFNRPRIVVRERRVSLFVPRREAWTLSCPAKRAFVSVGAARPAGARTARRRRTRRSLAPDDDATDAVGGTPTPRRRVRGRAQRPPVGAPCERADGAKTTRPSPAANSVHFTELGRLVLCCRGTVGRAPAAHAGA